MILLTGASGYIGRHMLMCAKEKDITIVCTKHSSVFSFCENVIACDLNDDRHIAKIASLELPIECVVHLAGFVDIKIIQDDDGQLRPGSQSISHLYNSNVSMAANLLECCLKASIKKIVFASSQSVYGVPQNNEPFSEYSAINPIEHYANSKFCAETIFKIAQKQGINTVVLRIPGVWGGDRKQGTVYNMVHSALRHKYIKISSDFPLPIDILHIDEVVRAIFIAMETDYKGFNVYNISSGEPCSLEIIAEILCELLPETKIIRKIPQPIVTMCNEKAKSELNFNVMPLKQRLATFIAEVKCASQA